MTFCDLCDLNVVELKHGGQKYVFAWDNKRSSYFALAGELGRRVANTDDPMTWPAAAAILQFAKTQLENQGLRHGGTR